MLCSYGWIGVSGHLNQFPRFHQGRELVAKLFSERLESRIPPQQTDHLGTGGIEPGLDVADGQI